MSQLIEVNFYGNQLTSESIKALSALTHLEALGLSGNQISDVTPLKDLINLKTLVVSFNQITDLSPLKHLTKLTDLRADNQLVKLPNAAVFSPVKIAFKDLDGSELKIQGAGEIPYYYDSERAELTWLAEGEGKLSFISQDGKFSGKVFQDAHYVK